MTPLFWWTLGGKEKGKWETGNGKWERERERERKKLPRVKGIRIRGL
jgi:hypothetical protein